MSKTYEEMLEYVGDPNQLLTIHEGTLSEGRQDGVRFMEVSNGGNLSVSVLPDRCMDLYQVHYKGKNMNYLAPCGIVAPTYYDGRGNQWLRSFFVGMLTTCGLQHIGPPVEKDGEEMGLHGRIDNTPAENVSYERGVKNEVPTLKLSGTMREARLFGENLTLKRELEFEYENDSIVLTDTVTNHGFEDRQFVYALHLNYGYPLLEEGTELIFDTLKTTPRTDHAAHYMDTWKQVEAPSVPYPERCYFQDIAKNEQGESEYTVFNRKRGLGVNVRYNGNDLPYFCEWKMLGKGEYVMGLEPINAELDGPDVGEEGCKAPVLAPGESKIYRTVISFIDQCEI